MLRVPLAGDVGESTLFPPSCRVRFSLPQPSSGGGSDSYWCPSGVVTCTTRLVTRSVRSARSASRSAVAVTEARPVAFAGAVTNAVGVSNSVEVRGAVTVTDIVVDAVTAFGQDHSGAPAGGFLGLVAAGALAVAVLEAGPAAVPGRGGVVGVHDRRLAPRGGAHVITQHQHPAQQAAEQPPARVHRDQVPTVRGGVQPAHPHPSRLTTAARGGLSRGVSRRRGATGDRVECGACLVWSPDGGATGHRGRCGAGRRSDGCAPATGRPGWSVAGARSPATGSIEEPVPSRGGRVLHAARPGRPGPGRGRGRGCGRVRTPTGPGHPLPSRDRSVITRCTSTGWS